MILKRLLSSSPPSTSWLLDETVAAVLRRESGDRVRCATAAMPDDVVEIGAVGLQGVDTARLSEVLAGLQAQVKGGRRAAAVIPSLWVRTHLMSFDHLPRRRTEIDDVVRWRLKKLLPVAPAQLRLATVALTPSEGKKRLLCMVGLETALASLEAAFKKLGVQLGALTPRLFALAKHAEDRTPYRLLVQQEPGFLSLLLLAGGVPCLLRSKQLVEAAGPWQAIAREQHMALSYVRNELGVSDQIQVVISAEAPELDHGLQAWWTDQELVSLETPDWLPSCNEPGVTELLGASRLAPVYAMLRG